MDVLELVDEARPDAPPIPHAARRHIRERLFNTGARPENPTTIRPEPVSPRLRRRARQVVSGFVVLVAIAGGAYALSRAVDSDEGPSEVATPTTIAAPTTSAPPAPTTTVAQRRAGGPPVRFTPLLPAAPEGYELLWAHYDGRTRRDNVGLARFVAPGATSELDVRLRPGELEPAANQAPTWRVDGRTVRAGGDGTCGGSSCSVEVQWNERTALSMSWVDRAGEALPDSATHESLLELLGTLRSRPGAWEPGPIDPSSPSWDTPSARHAALLLPADAEQVVDARQRAGWPGTGSAVFLAPDRSVIGMQEGDGPELPLDLTDARTVGDLTVSVVDADAPAPVYEIDVACGFARLQDEDGRSLDRTVVTELLGRATLDRGRIEIAPPAGWSLLDAGPGADVFETRFTQSVLGDDRVLTLIQSPGGSAASLMYGGRSFTATDDVGEEPAWVHEGDDGTVAVVSTRGNTAYEVRGEDVTVDDLAAVLGALVPETTAGWVEQFGPLETADLDTAACAPQPVLVVDAP